MNRVDEIKAEIIKLEKTSQIGIELYKQDHDAEFLKDAVYFSNEAHKLRNLLKEEYNITA